MARFTQINPEQATGKAKELLSAVQTKWGRVPNIARAMANSPAVLDGYLSLSGALAHGTLTAKQREQIALAVAQANGCDYCLAAHSAIGQMVGLSTDQALASRRGEAHLPLEQGLLSFAQKLVDQQGRISESDVQQARAAGLSDEVLAEVVANVALNILTNYFNHVADTDVDFPAVTPLAATAGACASGACAH